MILLANPVRFRPVNRTEAFDEILLLLEGFARDAVPALVVAFIDIPGRGDPADELLDAGTVPWLGRPDEVVERHVEAPPHVEELDGHPIAIRQRLFAKLLGFPEDILRMLVVAHHEMDIEPGEPLVARDDVGGDLLVRRPEMRTAIDVVDGGG